MAAENEPSSAVPPPDPPASPAPAPAQADEQPKEASHSASDNVKPNGHVSGSSTIHTSDAPNAASDEHPSEIDDTTMTEPQAAGSDANADGDAVAVAGDTATPSSKPKRRSSTKVPEHKKSKKAKKAKTELQLDAKPGDYYWARLKGFPPWPAMICDEEILPEVLLANRPVTAMRPDGTYRTDFEDGGKNVRDRTYPVLYLFTNEFSWIPNYDLKPLDLEELKNEEQGSKSKLLWSAYEVAKEGHDLNYFKQLMIDHELQLEEEQRRIEAEQAEKAAAKEAKEAEKAAKAAEKKAKAKERRTSKAADTDVSMVDADNGTEQSSAKKAKASKKRKAENEDQESAKTPKTKLKLSTPKEKESGSKAKPKKVTKPVEPQLSEEEVRERKEKEVLYLRHKLQKTFVSRDNPPEDEKMPEMNDLFNSLETSHRTLDVAIIRNTKINKVLKAIIKLPHIPRETEFNFKKRSVALLAGWNKALAEDTVNGPVGRDVNGTDKAEAAETPKAPETPKEANEPTEKEPAKTEEEAEDTAPAVTAIAVPTPPADALVDTSMHDAPAIEISAPKVDAAAETSAVGSASVESEAPKPATVLSTDISKPKAPSPSPASEAHVAQASTDAPPVAPKPDLAGTVGN